MIHDMKLRPLPFDQIRRGEKTVELRLNDEKRRQILIGDAITFTQTETGEQLTVSVTSLHPFQSFADLFAALGAEVCGGYHDMSAYYSEADQKTYGVLGIGFRL